MDNGGIIEGCSTLRVGYSDLSPATSFCQSIPKTPMNVGEPWETIGWAANFPNGSMRVFHGAGTTDEENAGQHHAEKEARLRSQHITFGSGDCSFANASEGFKGWGADEVAPPRS